MHIVQLGTALKLRMHGCGYNSRAGVIELEASVRVAWVLFEGRNKLRAGSIRGNTVSVQLVIAIRESVDCM